MKTTTKENTTLKMRTTSQLQLQLKLLLHFQVQLQLELWLLVTFCVTVTQTLSKTLICGDCPHMRILTIVEDSLRSEDDPKD